MFKCKFCNEEVRSEVQMFAHFVTKHDDKIKRRT